MFDEKNNIILWQNPDFIVFTPKNPHLSLAQGRHLVAMPKKSMTAAWDNPVLAGKCFALAAQVAKIWINLNLVQWANLQFNGNWGLLTGRTPFFHVHIYGRKKTSSTWGQPVVLPKLPGSFHFPTMPEQEIKLLKKTFKKQLNSK